MNTDISERFIAWSKGANLDSRVIEILLTHMPDRRGQFDVAEKIDSLDQAMSRNFPCDIDILDQAPNQHGYFLIGHCPNGDAVFVDTADTQLPVYYGEYGALYSGNLKDGMRPISESLSQYAEDYRKGETPCDFWDRST